MSKNSTKMILQRSFFKHFTKDCLVVISAIEINWIKETANLTNIILCIICYIKINKRNEEDSAGNIKVLAIKAS